MATSRSCRTAAAVQLAALGALLLVAQHAAATRICLNMIMKDEKENLGKCLDLIGAELSGWTLCDTGSTDGTPDIARKFFKKAKVPGAVVHHQWKDFSANRNLCIEAGLKWSLEQAKKAGLKKGSHFCEYLWFLDSDQFLHSPPGAKPGDLMALKLDQPVYHMMERGIGVEYANARLASTTLEWEWVGEVHEYVRRKDGVFSEADNVIEGYWLEHDASGGNDGKRFVRDEEILSRVVRERPNDPRANFYLGNTYRALDRVEEAITYYIRRIKLRAWSEEHFMSALNIADLLRGQFARGELPSPQVRKVLSSWEVGLHKRTPAEFQAERKAFDAALEAVQRARNATLAAAAASSNATSAAAGKGGKGHNATAALQATLDAASAHFDDLLAKRKAHFFPLLAEAYVAAMQVLPDRPEPYARLAKLYRTEQDDLERCYAYAVAGLAQGAPRADALFVDSNAWRFDLLDEACTCGYYVDRVMQQGQVQCRQLEQRLVEALDALEDKAGWEFRSRRDMLKRVRDNLGWYDKKGGCSEGASTCSWKQL